MFYWIKFVQCIFYIEDVVNKYLLTHLLPPVANGRQYVASKISASVNGALATGLSRYGLDKEEKAKFQYLHTYIHT